MADTRTFELDDLVNRPGTYFNPQTEVLVIVDDSPHIDTDLFDTGVEDGHWVLVSDEQPVDEHERDELLERFQVRHRPDAATGAPQEDFEDEEEEDEGVEELEA